MDNHDNFWGAFRALTDQQLSTHVKQDAKPTVLQDDFTPHNDLYWNGLQALGGNFIPEKPEPGEIGAKFPMMLTKWEKVGLRNETKEVLVLDEEEFESAKRNGFAPHPSLEIEGE